MKIYHIFTVEGEDHFPIDMLRWDECFPNSGDDSFKLGYEKNKRKVELGSYHEKSWNPSKERWNSFAWKIIEHRKIY